MPTVDIRFTNEGISASAYDDDEHASLIDEAWFTWDEVEERKGNGSDITFEL